MATVYDAPAIMPETRFGLTGIESMRQNVQIIATRMIGQTVLDRGLGLDSSILSRPENYARILLPSVIIQGVEEGEPRVQVVEVIMPELDYSDQSNFGAVAPIVRFIEREV